MFGLYRRGIALLAAIGALLFIPVTAAPVQSGRLPSGIAPIHYDIMVIPDPVRMTFSGSETITVKVSQTQPSITINAADIKIAQATIDGVAARSIVYDKTAQTVSLTFATPVKVGEHKLSFAWDGKINQSAAGLFAIDYTGADGHEARMLATQFEAPDARRFAPMFDEPAQKATFTLSAISPKGQTAYSNMPVTSKQDVAAGTLWHFAQSPKMSSYLLFLGMGDIDRKSVISGNTEIGIITRKGVADQGDYALASAKRLLAYYNDYFGVPYPLPKMDMIAAPGSSQFFGAMENWGAILYFERTVLIDPKLGTESQRQDVFGTVAHEMAHQWFGDLVTMAWWDDLWLNEGFASWMASKVANDLNPDWGALDQSLAFDRQGAMSLDARSTTHPIIQKITTVDQISQAFDSITYRKGEAVIRMLEASIGADPFRAGVRSYMAKHAYANTVTADLWSELAKASGKPVADIMNGFTLQGGVPLVQVGEPRCVNGQTQIALSQRRFGLDAPSKQSRIWKVPVRLSAGQAALNVIVSGAVPRLSNVSGCGSLIVNAGQSAYFRTLYTPAHFEKLRANFGALALADQIGLLADSYALANGGYLPVDSYLALLGTVKADASPLIWQLAAGQIEAIDDRLRGTPDQAAFQTKTLAMLRPVFARVGWKASGDEQPAVGQLRERLIPLLGRFGDQPVRNTARDYAEQSFIKPESVSGPIRLAAVPVAALVANAQEWEVLHQRAKAEKSPVARRLYYSYLGAVADPVLARKALALALSDEAPVPMRTSIVRAVANEHPDMAFKWAVANVTAVNALVEENTRSGFIPELGSGSSDRKTADEIVAFATKNLPAASRSDAMAAASLVRYRANVRAAQSAAIGKWARRE